MEYLLREELRRFNYLVSEINSAYHDMALKLGLSDSAMQILYTICAEGEECLLLDVVQLSGMSKQTVNSALRKLEADNIVCLERHSGRLKRLSLTEKGKALCGNTVSKVFAIENSIFDSWTRDECCLYIGLTERYLKAFREKVKELQ